ncbi:unnamed protein product [Lactuca saligna]|uniref:HhH-GPD domain-containing protein n=1 Tax=Lactuca saligna TaxID=75948 RepID=A0AA35YM25_LACSI|nr:unnamed protein product [Lactuca saligna]
MEIYGVFEPLTPSKPVPARSEHNTQVASTSGRGTEKENINDEFLCTSSLGTTEYLEDNGNKRSSVLGVAGKDPISSTTDQNNTSCIQEETKCNDNKAHGVHESNYGINNSIPSVPSPSETKDSRKRRNNGIDLNKKPNKRTRMKKHRPKVYDDSKPKKVQKPKTPKPKTPKPVTPNRVHEKSVRSRKEKFKEPTSCMQKSTSYVDQRDSKLHEETICMQNSVNYNIEDVEQASRVSRNALIPMIQCKRRLDLNYPVEGESKSHDKHLSFNFDNGDYDFFGRIVTSKRNTKRRSRFQKKSVEIEASEDLLDDNNNKQQYGLDFSVIEKLKQTKKHVRRFVYVYTCQKKRNSMMQVYERKCRLLDQCLQSSRKSGPNFPKLFKKQRKMRKKVTINPNWLLKFLENSKKKKEPHKKLKKKVAKNNLLLLPIFSPMKKKRSILQTRRRENLVDFPISKATSLYDERFLLCQEENFLQMTECLPLQEVPIHEIDNFTSLPLHCQGVENTVAALDWLQSQEVPLLESQSLKKDRNRKSQSRKRDQSRKSQSLIPKQKDSKLYIREMTKYITKKLAKLDINAECKAIVVRNNDNRALVKTKAKKEKEKEKEKKILAKVDLDEESERVWKIVMENDGSQPFEEMDNDKKEWWERQRNVFRGRVDSFIAKMHLIQGNRRFSPWKGSVVDSVVGVYLTQNVTDHLSSSAFMCLAARFPGKSKNKEVVDHDEEVNTSQESVKSNTEIVEGFSNNNKMEENMSISYADEINMIPTKNKEVVDHFEVNISQESVKNNTEIYEGFFNNNKIDQNTITSYDNEINVTQNTQLSQTEASNLEDKSCIDENPRSFRNLLDLNEVDCLRNFYNIDESALDEIKVVEESTLGEEKSKCKESEASNLEDKTFVDENLNTFRKVLETEEADYLNNFCSINVDESALNESHVQEKSTFGQEKSTLGDEKSTFEAQKSTMEEEKSTLEVQKSSMEVEKSTIEEQKSTIEEQKSTIEEETRIVAPISSLQSEIIMEQGVKVVNNRESNKKGKSTIEEGKSTIEEEARIVAPISSLESEITMEQGVKVVNKKKGKKKSKKEQKEEVKIDWEKFREIYSQNGKKEINEDFMDAVDWEAVYNTPVQEIANLIVERGMNNVLAIRIKDFLNRMVKDHGSIDLEWLRDIPPDKAKEFLLSIPGIGLKSVECVRLLTLHHNAFPVDTNVGRVATRLGWVPLQPLPEQVQIHLLNSYPMVDTIQKYLYPRLCTLDQKTLYELHYQLITFGKVFCTKLNPNCNACPMRAECRHYASAFASARLALPGPKGSSTVTTTIIPAPPAPPPSPPPLPPVQPPPPLVVADMDMNDCDSNSYVENCEPIIEIPASPEPYVEVKLPDIEDYFCESEDEIPTIRLSTQEFEETLKETINKKNNLSFPETDDVSKAIVALSHEAASFRVRVRPIKHTGKLRTIHIVYELPDFHPILAGLDEREQEDPSRYLLAIWPEISSSKNIQEETVKGTILIPCRTANRGKFPLNGTYFQVNEVFADDETSDVPMDVPRHFLWNLARRDLACGTSATSIFKALSTSDIQHIFWRGSICVRGFNRKTRQPRPLHRRFHVSTTVNSTGNKKTPKK